jgi:hypothetical protein
MKAIALILLLVLLCVVLFLTGVFSPWRSRRLQTKVDALSRRGEAKADRNAGTLGDLARDGLEKARGAADASARAGRSTHRALSPDD